LSFDFNDPDKVLAVMPSGVSGRLLNPHRTDQIESFMNDGKLYWWFSDKEIDAHTQNELVLKP
jgi:penicillin amidase